jgi:hypothetical protein
VAEAVMVALRSSQHSSISFCVIVGRERRGEKAAIKEGSEDESEVEKASQLVLGVMFHVV